MNKLNPILLSLMLVFATLWVITTTNPFAQLFISRANSIYYDVQLRVLLLVRQGIPLSPVAVVDIDDRSRAAIGRWPWPREKLAQLVTAINQQGATVIAFDMFFSEPEANLVESVLTKLKAGNQLNATVQNALKQKLPLFNDDIVFANSLKNEKTNLAYAFSFRDEQVNTLFPPAIVLTPAESSALGIEKARGYIANIPILQNAVKGGGFINVFPDPDGIIRRAPIIMEYQRGIYPSLALEAVRLYLNEKIKLVTHAYGDRHQLEAIQLGDRIIPVDAKGEVLIPFVGGSYTFPYFSAVDVLMGKVPKNSLSKKIIFIGTSAAGSGDLLSTAIQNPLPGAELQATMANGILNVNFSYVPVWSDGLNVFLVIVLGLIGSFWFPFLGPRALASIMVLFLPVLLVLNIIFWIKTGLVIYLLVPAILVFLIALGNVFYGYMFESRRREEIKLMFGHYVPEEHIDEMLKHKSDYALHGENRNMSVVFADIRNFTSLSEKIPVTVLVEVLNAFFTPMTEIIFKHKGTIDKYIGDQIMAFWGAPLKDEQHARHALEAAVDMQRKINELAAHFKSKNWPDIQIGIGITSGMMSVGDMGSNFRQNYTVMGDAVNLGSRLEGLTKFYGVDIIVSEETERNQPGFVFRKLDRVRVKGKKTEVEIYELIGVSQSIPSELMDELEEYHQALELYFAQQWDEALVIMLKLHHAFPNKKLYHLYVDRIQEFQTHPVPSDWDGVYSHKLKYLE